VTSPDLREMARIIQSKVRGATYQGQLANGMMTSFPGLGLVGVDEAVSEILALVTSTKPGWRLVPVEPSDAMTREGSDVFANRFGLRDDPLVLPMAVQGVYRAMIASAPTPGPGGDQ
jgi:hypothetical protein